MFSQNSPNSYGQNDFCLGWWDSLAPAWPLATERPKAVTDGRQAWRGFTLPIKEQSNSEYSVVTVHSWQPICIEPLTVECWGGQWFCPSSPPSLIYYSLQRLLRLKWQKLRPLAEHSVPCWTSGSIYRRERTEKRKQVQTDWGARRRARY